MKGQSIDALAPREREIVHLMVDGLSNKKIAQQLNLSVDTVRWYNKEIHKKLDVHNRAETVRVAIEAGILGSTVPEPAIRAKHNIPAALPELVGRRDDVDIITAVLAEPSTRLLTLVGTGGVGKTSVALEIARYQVEHFVDGAFFVPLAAESMAEGMLTVIAQTLGFPLETLGDPLIVQVQRFLRPKQLLLVLDNVEQLVADARVLADLLAGASGLKLLVTSREPLRLQEERLYRLKGMSFPEDPTSTELESFEAVQLLKHEVVRLQPEYVPMGEDLAYMAGICRSVGGLPLAILLAASWIDVMSLADIASAVEESLDLLEVDVQDLPARHRSIRGLFDASWNQLTAHEQDVFRSLSGIPSSFGREAALAIADTNVQTLARLVRKSLLQYRAPQQRYSLHPLLRQYGLERLEAAGLTGSVAERHGAYYGAFVVGSSDAISGGDQVGTAERFEADYDNIRAAWHHAVASRNDELVVGMCAPVMMYCDMAVRLPDAMHMLTTALPRFEGQEAWCELGLFHDFIGIQAGALPPGSQLIHDVIAKLDAGDDRPDLAERRAVADVVLAFVLLAVEDKQDEAFTLCQRLYTDDPEMKAYWRIRLLMFVGLSSAGRGEHELTLSAFDQSYDLGHASGDYAGAVLAPSFSMLVTLRANKLQRIARYLRKAEQTEAILPDKQSFVTRVLVPGLLFVWRAEFDSIPRRFEVAVKNDAENNVMFHGLLLALQSLYWGYHGNREGAYRAREQINDEAVMGLMPDVLAWALWGLCLADGHASAWSEARENLRQMRDIERMLHSVVPEHRPLALLIYALEEAAADRPDSALEALSLAGAEPSNARKMYAAWPVLGPLRRDLDASSDRPKPPVPDVDRVLESYFRADSVSKEA